MGWRLACEVMENYHGPDHKWRWLMCLAWSANDSTRIGWPGREVMVARTDKSPTRVSHLATELEADKVIERVGADEGQAGAAGRGRGTMRYRLLPLAEGSRAANPDGAGKGASATHPKAEVKGAPDGRKGAPATHDRVRGRPPDQPEPVTGSHGDQRRSSRAPASARAGEAPPGPARAPSAIPWQGPRPPRSQGEAWRQQHDQIIDDWVDGRITTEEKKARIEAIRGLAGKDTGLGQGDPFRPQAQLTG